MTNYTGKLYRKISRKEWKRQNVEVNIETIKGYAEDTIVKGGSPGAIR